MVLRSGAVELQVAARGARYPIRLDPIVQVGSKLTGSGESSGAQFGYSVALSADGQTAVVGAPDDNGFVGSARVFVRSGSSWTQQAALAPTGATNLPGGLYFGISVAISPDGSTVAVGGTGNNNFTGAVWVFTRSGQTWSEQAGPLTPDDASGRAQMGSWLALSGDGSTLVASGSHDNGLAGAVWMFTRSGQTWSQQGPKLTEAGESGDGTFGTEVAVSGDGNMALIGSPGDNNSEGTAWVFTRSGSTWTQGAKLTSVAHGGTGGSFGGSVALSSDGSTALIGEPCYGRGAAWVFTRSGSAWTRRKELIVNVTQSCYFGGQLALSADGNTAIVGTNHLGHNYTGAAWVFAHTSASNWTQIGSPFTPNDETGQAYFGSAVATSADGSSFLISGPVDNNSRGAAWVFDRTGAPCNYANTIKASSGLTGYWRLGESSGTTATDSSSAGHNGTYTGGFTLGQPGAVLGDSNTSVSLNGTTGKVALPSLGTASSWTIEGWTNLSGNAAGYNALYASGNGARLLIQPNGVYADDLTGGAGSGHIDPSTDSNVGAWVFWALVRNGSTLTLYRNGVPIGTSSLAGHGPTSLNGTIGAQGPGYHLNGRADEIAVYTTALSASALQSQYTCSGWG
jgi:hypothetical protein